MRRSRFSTQLPGLDGLRAVACLMVFAVHFSQITHLRGSYGPFDIARLLENGNSGVALFFALSGFLLSLPYWRAIEGKNPLPSTPRFLLRRAARIAPAYFFCLTALIIANRLWEEDAWLPDALLHYAFAFNFFDATIFSINPPFWTVAVEVQFYLLLPLIFFVVRPLPFAKAVWCVALLALGAYAAHWAVMRHMAASQMPGTEASPALAYSVLAHLPHFLFGVVTAWLFVRRNLTTWTPSQDSAPAREVALWIAIVLVLVVLGTSADDILQTPYGRYNFPYVPLLFCLVILLTPLTTTGVVLFDNPPMRGVGAVSYGVYIYHLPVLHIVARLMQKYALNPRDDWFLFGATSLAATLTLATASYWIIERPILLQSKRW